MLWSLVTVAALGFLVGLRFRVPALLVVSAATVVGTVVILDGPLLQRVLLPLLVLQCAYFGGLLVASRMWRRGKP